MARLGFCFESHLLIVLCHNSPKESLCLFAYAFSSLCVSHSPGIVFFTVFSKSDLPNNTFKQVLDIMMKSSWCLDKFAVKHNGTGPSLWMEREKRRWVEMYIFSPYILSVKQNKSWLKVRECLHCHEEPYCIVGKCKFELVVLSPYLSWFCRDIVRNLIWPMVLNVRQQ